MITRYILLAALACAAATPADAAPETASRAKRFSDVTACREISDDKARLQCFDRSVALIDAAERDRDIAIVDRGQMRETRKTLFGLALPRIAILGGSDEDKRDAVDRIETSLSEVDVDRYGHWMFRLADGARWRQIDDNVVARRPRAGDAVVIKRAALGSYKMNVSGQPTIKVRREN